MNDLFTPLLDPSTVTMRELLGGKRPPRNLYEEKWTQFHRANPRVYTLFKRFTEEWLHRGFDNGSSHMIIHRIRWETAIPHRDENPITGEPLKISNGQFPYYARLWMEEFPWNEGFFRTKRLKVTHPAYGPWPEHE